MNNVNPHPPAIPKDPMALVSLVAPKASLQGIRFRSGAFEVDERERVLPDSPPESVNQSVRHDGQLLVVNSGFILRLPVPGKPGEVTFKADFESKYELREADSLPPEAIDAFGRINSIYNVWPYWREYVQGASMRLSLPPLVLHLLTAVGAMRLAGYKPIARSAPSAGT